MANLFTRMHPSCRGRVVLAWPNLEGRHAVEEAERVPQHRAGVRDGELGANHLGLHVALQGADFAIEPGDLFREEAAPHGLDLGEELGRQQVGRADAALRHDPLQELALGLLSGGHLWDAHRAPLATAAPVGREAVAVGRQRGAQLGPRPPPLGREEPELREGHGRGQLRRCHAAAAAGVPISRLDPGVGARPSPAQRRRSCRIAPACCTAVSTITTAVAAARARSSAANDGGVGPGPGREAEGPLLARPGYQAALVLLLLQQPVAPPGQEARPLGPQLAWCLAPCSCRAVAKGRVLDRPLLGDHAPHRGRREYLLLAQLVRPALHTLRPRRHVLHETAVVAAPALLHAELADAVEAVVEPPCAELGGLVDGVQRVGDNYHEEAHADGHLLAEPNELGRGRHRRGLRRLRGRRR